jgi:hypothetical protein
MSAIGAAIIESAQPLYAEAARLQALLDSSVIREAARRDHARIRAWRALQSDSDRLADDLPLLRAAEPSPARDLALGLAAVAEQRRSCWVPEDPGPLVLWLDHEEALTMQRVLDLRRQAEARVRRGKQADDDESAREARIYG